MWRCLKSPKRHKNNVIDVVLVSLLLTLKKFQTFFMCFYCWIWKSTCRRNEMMVNSSFTIQWEMLVKDKPGKTNMDVLTNLKKFVKKKKIKTRIAIFRQRNVNEIYLKKKQQKMITQKTKKLRTFSSIWAFSSSSCESISINVYFPAHGLKSARFFQSFLVLSLNFFSKSFIVASRFLLGPFNAFWPGSPFKTV